ncbi:hypothetical protein [Kribbella sp. CA-247076]|uniref:hypothetical protein n=1 Tax=Kribbella sp. CA-247076 TaxID=3239941 RepID=UPI003D8CF4A2
MLIALKNFCRSVLVVSAVVLAGCSGGGQESDGSGATVEVSIQDGKTEPSGDVVKVRTGEQVTVKITSDIDDEVHVHSTPDHSFQVAPGEQVEETFSFSAPGTYEMESHRLKKLIAKFEVR